MTDHRDAGYDDWLDAIGAGDGYYLECPNGHGSLPPRRACPECGDPDLVERDLPEAGTVVTHTEVHVATPQLSEDTPYVTAIADFGPVRLTGMLRGEDADRVEVGTTVAPVVTETATTGERVLAFEVS